MLETLLEAFLYLFSWPNVMYLVIGTVFSQMIGILPGLGGSVALALMMPVTYSMEPAQAMILLGAALGGVDMGGAITAILFNAPGTASSLATAFDGYPAARQGRAGEALGVAATSCAIGAVFGVIIFLLAVPVMRTIVLAFGPPEFFWMAVFAMTLLAAVSGGSLLNGLLAATFGLLLSFHGLNPVTGGHRFAFGSYYLWDGIPFVPAMIGLFAIAELINLIVHRETIAERGVLEVGGVWKGIKFTFSKWWLAIRCSALGLVIGAIPGVGASVSQFLAYAHARNTSRSPETFGKGNLEGVVASETNNDSKDAGALMPLVSLGIPGSPSTAVLLGGLIMHGLTPGKPMLVEELGVTMVLLLALTFSIILTAAIGLVTGSLLARVTTLSTGLVVPVMMTLTLVGAFGVRHNLVDVAMAIGFGFLGYAMNVVNFPRVPVVLGLVLGPLAEQSFHGSLQIGEGSLAIFFTRPLSVALVVLTMLGLLSPVLQLRRARKKQRQAAHAA